MDEEYAHGRSDDLTAFEIRIKGFSHRILSTLCQKGFSPQQSLRIIIEKEVKADFHEITWAIAEAILFIEISRRYARLSDKKVTTLFDYEDNKGPFSDCDDGMPF